MQLLAPDQPDAYTLLGFAEEIEFSAGDVLIRQSESDASVFILKKGTLEVIVSDGESKQTVATIDPFALVGEQSFIDGGPRTATVQATTDGVAHRLTDAAFEELRGKHPDLACAFLLDVARGLAQRCRQRAQ